MDFDNRQRPPMNDVSDLNLTCVECGVEIKELPFTPTKRDDGTYGRLYCRECNRNRRGFGSSRGGGGGGGGFRRDFNR
ncbi:MAG: hypothetical protein Q8L57_01165 [bacterium]|nr:hypothetical protein [bacterium]